MNKLSWMSPNLGPYLESAYGSLTKIELMIKNLNDIIAVRIDGVNETIKAAKLVTLPDPGDVWSIEEFKNKTEQLCTEQAEVLE
jgi:hypothetical protein